MEPNQFAVEPATASAAPPANNAGRIGFVLSLVGLLCGCLWPVSLVVSIIGLKREPRHLALAGTIISAAGVLLVLPFAGILVAIAIPGFLKARETSRLNACQENLIKIDGAVQSYILDNNLADQAAAVTALNADLRNLVGPGNFLRAMPVCPAGGTYVLVPEGDAPAVYCTITGHDYPGTY